MARSAVFDSLAPLVDYLNKDSQVSLSTLADYLTTEDENRQVSLSGLVDAAQRGYRPQSKFEQDVVKPTMDFAIDKMAPKIGEMAKATPAGIGAIVTADIPAMVDMADPLIVKFNPEARSIPPSSIVAMSVPSTSNMILPASPPVSAVAVEISK